MILTKEPRPLIQDILQYKQAGTVLDIGAGSGTHALYLASKGFHVTAVESKQNRAQRIQEYASTHHLKIHVVHEEIQTFTPTETYDVIISTMVLHFFSPKEIEETIAKMKAWASPGGIHVINVYTDKNKKGLRPYLFKSEELRSHYKDWNIKLYIEKIGPYIEHPTDNGPHRRYHAELIAQRPLQEERKTGLEKNLDIE